MLLWDGDLLNFHFGDTDHSLSSWGVAYSHGASVSSSHGDTSSHWTDWGFDGLALLQGAHQLADNSVAALPGGAATDQTSHSASAGLASDGPSVSAFVLPTVLKVEEPFAMPLPAEFSAALGEFGAMSDLSPVPQSHGPQPFMGMLDPFVLSIQSLRPTGL